MVNYSTSATTLLALVSLITGTAAETSSRKLYANWDSKEVETDTIVDKKCEEIIAGNPQLCTRVCDVVTTTMMGDKVIDEYSKVTESKCVSHGGAKPWSGSSTTYGLKAVGSTTYGSKATSSSTSYGSKATVSSTSYGSKASGLTTYGSKAVGSTTYGSKATSSSTSYGSKATSSSTSYGSKASGSTTSGSKAVGSTTYGSKATSSSTSYGSKATSSSTSYGSKASGSTTSGSKAVGSTTYGSKAVSSTTYGGKGGKPNGSSTSTTYVNTSSGGWGAVPAPTPVEIIVTPSPTTCMEQEYYNDGGICTNDGITPPGGTAFPTLLECCEETQTVQECEFVDICCEMRLWYLSESGECTNGFVQDGEFASLQECCEATQSDEEDCLYEDVCVQDPPAPAPTPVEIIVTPSPTTCMEQEYYTAGGVCTNEGITPPGGTAFPTLLECCEETQTVEECEFVDICCEMRLWYLSESGECTNGFTQDGEFASLQECCEVTQPGAEDCLYDDICNPDPPAPTPIEFVTMVPTLEFTPEPTLVEGTGEPSFGSTPTVSKEVTGPPTKGRN